MSHSGIKDFRLSCQFCTSTYQVPAWIANVRGVQVFRGTSASLFNQATWDIIWLLKRRCSIWLDHTNTGFRTKDSMYGGLSIILEKSLSVASIWISWKYSSSFIYWSFIHWCKLHWVDCIVQPHTSWELKTLQRNCTLQCATDKRWKEKVLKLRF